MKYFLYYNITKNIILHLFKKLVSIMFEILHILKIGKNCGKILIFNTKK